MPDNRQQDEMDQTMSALTERLRTVSENLRRSREAAAGVPAAAAAAGGSARAAAVSPERHSEMVRNLHNDFIPDRLPVSKWPDFLKKLSLKLEAITGDTESEFLAIGAKLHDFRQRANKISEISEQVARLITDRQINRDVEELGVIISEMKEWLTSSKAQADMAGQHLNARMLVDKTGICLNTLQKKYYKSEFMLKGFTNKTDEIVESIYSVIESLQYNDITRQRIEHVKAEVDAIEKSLTGMGIGRSVTDIGGVRELVGEIGGMCVIQAKELRKARAEFEVALKSVSENLMVVSRDTAEMSDDIMQVVKGDSDSGKSFMSSIGNWLSSLTDSLTSFGLRAAEDDADCTSIETPEEFSGMVRDLCAIVGSLRKVNGNVLYRLSLMEDETKILSREIDEAVGKFGVNSKIVWMSDGIASGLDKVAEEASVIAPEEVKLHSVGMKGRFSGGRNAANRSKADSGVELF